VTHLVGVDDVSVGVHDDNSIALTDSQKVLVLRLLQLLLPLLIFLQPVSIPARKEAWQQLAMTTYAADVYEPSPHAAASCFVTFRWNPCRHWPHWQGTGVAMATCCILEPLLLLKCQLSAQDPREAGAGS
jgi:hypothetical protein